MPVPRPCLTLVASLLALATTAAVAQQADLPARDHPITIDVRVEDKLGHPVHGLDAHNFTITDNGQPQQLAGFKAISDPPQVILVLDMINTGFDEVAYERAQLTSYLNQDGGKLRNVTSIMAMTENGMKTVNGAGQDGHALIASLQRLDTDLRAITRAGGGYWGATERLEMSLTQLSQLGAYLAAQPGLKMVLIIGPGWPMLPGAGYEEDHQQRAWVFNLLVQLTNGLREAHIALCSLDPYQLGNSNPFYYQSYLKGVKQLDHAEYPYLALPVLAEHSGGRALTQGKDVLGEINTAMRDAGAYYELTFNPVPGDHPNEYHELRVKVDQPDETVRTASSYYANVRPAGKSASPSKSAPPVGQK